MNELMNNGAVKIYNFSSFKVMMFQSFSSLLETVQISYFGIKNSLKAVIHLINKRHGSQMLQQTIWP